MFKKIKPLLLVLLLLAAGPALATKNSLPLQIICTSPAAGQAVVKITFSKAGSNVVVYLGEMGSVSMKPSWTNEGAVSAGQTVQLNANFDPGNGASQGGITVGVSGNFGAGQGSQVQTFVLVAGPTGPTVTPRDGQGKPVMVVPSVTTH